MVYFHVGEGVKGDEEVMERFEIQERNYELWGRLYKKIGNGCAPEAGAQCDLPEQRQVYTGGPLHV